MKQSMKTVLAVALLVTFLSGIAMADDRAVKSRVTPSYPELAKKMNVVGSVKVEVVVASTGVVKSAKAMGGHPLLIDAAVNAAKGYKYVPGEETTEHITFNFGNSN